MKKKIIILLAHGSPEPYAKKNLIELKKKFKQYLKDNSYIIEHAFLQFNKPSLRQCLNKYNQQSEIVILPIFISHGRHTLSDIPEIVDNFQKKYKLNIKVREPFNDDKSIVHLLYKRFKGVNPR